MEISGQPVLLQSMGTEAMLISPGMYTEVMVRRIVAELTI